MAMRNDVLQISVQIESAAEEPEYRLLVPEIRINGERVGEGFAIDMSALTASTQRSGEFYIFTCGCGDSGCAGIDDGVIVLYRCDTISWLIPDPLSTRLPQPSWIRQRPSRASVYRKYWFSSRSYRRKIAAALAEAKRLYRSETPSPELCPYGFKYEQLEKLKVSDGTGS